MGLLLSILFSYVGAVELMFIVRDIVHQVGLHHERMKLNQTSPKTTIISLLDLQNNLRKSIKSAQERLCETDSVHSMADGVLYEEGYRVLSEEEQNSSNNWLKARASITTEPSQSLKLSFKENCDGKAVTVNSCYQYDKLLCQDDSMRSSNLSVDTSSFQIEKNHLSDNIDRDEVLDIHFDEYSQDYLHALDGATKKGYRKNEDSRRRKSCKIFTDGHLDGDITQRRRSEDDATDNPWGELNPKSFHDDVDSLCRRERAMSIAENDEPEGFVDEKTNSYYKRDPQILENISSIDNDNLFSSNNINETKTDSHGVKKSDVSKAIEKIQNLPEILIDGSNMDEMVEGNVVDYIKYDGDDSVDDGDEIAANKLQFKEYLETVKPTRLRYESPTYDDDRDIDNEDELKECSLDENNEYELKDLANDCKLSNSKRAINNRKPNMFASAMPKRLEYDKNKSQNDFKPVIRITPTEDERIEKFLHENCDQVNEFECNRATDTLIKSQTIQMFDCRTDDNMEDLDSFESNSRPQSPSSIDITGRDSLLSETSSDQIHFECKESTIPSFLNSRRDSSTSNKSNVCFERSQSRFSELEYIRGREDWKDTYLRYDISEEIDSDNYHHLRRHSETAEMLEYILGREDSLQHAKRNSLPRIFELNESKIVIQDEIDSDEYHHNLFRNYLYTKSTVQEIKSFNVNVETDNCSEQFVEKENYKHIAYKEDLTSETLRYADNVKHTSSNEASIADPINIIFNQSNNITEVMTIHEMDNREDIEIAIVDLISGSVQENNIHNPFIVISEAPDEYSEASIYQTVNQEHIDKIYVPPIEKNENNLASTENAENNDASEIKNETIVEQNETKSLETVEQNSEFIRAKSETQSSISLLNYKEQKPKRTLSFENVEDLIRDVSSGPWFHK